MKTELPDTSIFIRIAKVQEQRRANWLPGFAIDRDLEYAHQTELSILRNELSAGKVAVSETPPAGPIALNSHRGGCFGSVGNLLSRMFRRILPQNQ